MIGAQQHVQMGVECALLNDVIHSYVRWTTRADARRWTPERIFNGDFLGFIYFMKAFLLIVVKGVLACYICYASLHKVEKKATKRDFGSAIIHRMVSSFHPVVHRSLVTLTRELTQFTLVHFVKGT